MNSTQTGVAGSQAMLSPNASTNTRFNQSPITYWEQVASTTRWGRYTSTVIEDAVRRGISAAAPPTNALDVGCEGGRWSQLAADAGWPLTCTDVDERALAICQQRIPDARCIRVSSEDRTLPAGTQSVGLLLCIEVSPVIDSDWFAAEAKRVLRPGGIVIGVLLNRTSLRGEFVRAKHRLGICSEEYYRWSYRVWRAQMRRHGFSFEFERGLCWFPLSRASNSILTSPFVVLERMLGLSHVPSLSPWVVFVAKSGAGH
jgi:SAM-dependent methyltransferase